MLDIIYVFVGKGGMEHAFTYVASLSYQGVFPLEGDKRVWSKYEVCAIPLHELLFSFIVLCLPFDEFVVDVLDHLGISPCNFIQ